MTVKKSYALGDTVWIYGISRSNTKPTQGKVIKAIDLSDAGYAFEHYVVEVPTHIESLLEIRTWHNISQDEKGPVGSLRTLGDVESTLKFANTVGFIFDDAPELDTTKEQYEDEIDPNIIHAALEQSQKDTLHQPLNLKETKKPRRRFVRKKTKE